MTEGLKDAHREAIIAVIAANDRVERAVLFGSRSTGTNTVSSDVDIALFGDRLTLTDQARLAAALDEIPMAQSVDLILYDSIRNRTLQEHIRDYGVEWFARPTRNRGFETSPESVSEWLTVTVEDLSEKVAMGPFGSSIKVSTFVPKGVPIINGQHLHGVRVDDSAGFKFITHEHACRLANANVQRGDVVLTHRGTIGQVSCVPEDSQFDRYIVSQSQFYIRCDRSRAIPEFVALYFTSAEGQHQLLANASQVGVPSIAQPVTYLRTLPVPLPPLSEQRAIAHVLGTLDDKIDLNRRMNETLEAMARALFKSWFVDFDPVRAKMEGRHTGLPQDIADLFPDRLVDSELGEIPEGWEVASLGDVAALRRKGIDPASEASDTPYIGLADMPRGSIALTDWGETGSVSSRKSAFKAGDILFGKLRPYFHKVGIAPVDGLCSTDIVVLGARKPKWSAFVLACVSSSAFVAHTSQTATGTKMPRTSWQAMRRYELGRPTDTMASEFQRTVSPMLRRIVSNIHESRTLTALRDALLPKLISGEIRVPEVARALESVT